MEAYGLGSSHTLCVCRLFEASEGLSKTRLAALCGVDKAQISRVISELQEKGYVHAIHAPTCYRQRYRLTESGRRMAECVMADITEINGFVSGAIPPEELASFYRTMKSICDNLKKAEVRYLEGDTAAAEKGKGVTNEEQ